MMKQWYIATAVAILYLAMNLAFDIWSWSWIIWVVYALYRLWDRRKTGMEQGTGRKG